MSLEQLNLLLRVCGRKDAEEGGKEGREGGRREEGRVGRGEEQAGRCQGSDKSQLRRHRR